MRDLIKKVKGAAPGLCSHGTGIPQRTSPGPCRYWFTHSATQNEVFKLPGRPGKGDITVDWPRNFAHPLPTHPPHHCHGLGRYGRWQPAGLLVCNRRYWVRQCPHFAQGDVRRWPDVQDSHRKTTKNLKLVGLASKPGRNQKSPTPAQMSWHGCWHKTCGCYLPPPGQHQMGHMLENAGRVNANSLMMGENGSSWWINSNRNERNVCRHFVTVFIGDVEAPLEK